jgi:hypothetical protein
MSRTLVLTLATATLLGALAPPAGAGSWTHRARAAGSGAAPRPVYVSTGAVRRVEPPPVVSPPPAPAVVQYAGGRYELRGDGVSAPYRWDWIPAAASAPAPPGSWSPSQSAAP